MTDRPIRASDQERESVVDVLRDAFTDGRLTFDEFEERTAAAYAAKTWGQLRELTADLPAQPRLGADLDRRLQAPPPQPLPPGLRPRPGRLPSPPRSRSSSSACWPPGSATADAGSRTYGGHVQARHSAVILMSVRADGYHGSAGRAGRRIGLLDNPRPAGNSEGAGASSGRLKESGGGR